MAIALPSFVAIGGALDDENIAIHQAMLVRNDVNKIVIVPYASGDPEKAAQGSIERFKKYRPDATYVVLPDAAKDDASRDLAASWIGHADLVFFTGGDQKRLIARFGSGEKPNAVLQALNNGMRKWGTLVAGTSAGAAMMSDPMFLGGGSESALSGELATDGEDGDPGAREADREPPKGVRLGPGLGLVPNVIIDTHFFPRGRVGRLIAAVDQQKGYVGLGIDEDRAVRIAGGRLTAVGTHAALLVAGPIARDGLSRLGAKATLMCEGDRVTVEPNRSAGADGELRVECDFAHDVVALDDAARRAMLEFADAQDEAARARDRFEDDAWGRNVALQMLRRLAADPSTAQRAKSKGFELVIRADDKTRFAWDGRDPDTLRVADAIADVIVLNPSAPASAPAPAMESTE
jgi:cyanophycinase